MYRAVNWRLCRFYFAADTNSCYAEQCRRDTGWAKACEASGGAGASPASAGAAPLLGGGAGVVRPPCVNGCRATALPGSCPKHGGPKLACSNDCYKAWKDSGGRHVAGKVVVDDGATMAQQERQEFESAGQLRAIREQSDSQRFQASLAARQQAREQAFTFSAMMAGLTWA